MSGLHNLDCTSIQEQTSGVCVHCMHTCDGGGGGCGSSGGGGEFLDFYNFLD